LAASGDLWAHEPLSRSSQRGDHCGEVTTAARSLQFAMAWAGRHARRSRVHAGAARALDQLKADGGALADPRLGVLAVHPALLLPGDRQASPHARARRKQTRPAARVRDPCTSHSEAAAASSAAGPQLQWWARGCSCRRGRQGAAGPHSRAEAVLRPDVLPRDGRVEHAQHEQADEVRIHLIHLPACPPGRTDSR